MQMKMMNRLFPISLSLLMIILAGCREGVRQDPPEGDISRLSVYVVNYPLQYFAQRIGGEYVDVSFPAPPEVDPAEWRPDEETILRFQQADLILLNGAGYARWVGHASLPARVRVDTSAHFRDRLLEEPEGIFHSHGDGPAHSHAGLAFTTWLDPMLAIEHARAVKDALSRRIPSGQPRFEERFLALMEDLRAIDRALEEIVRSQPNQPLLASHPVYQYLEARYGLNLRSLHWEPEELPEEPEWEALRALQEQHPAQWILWEDEPLPETSARLSEMGVASIVYNPCAQPPEEGDFLSVMQANVENLRTAFRGRD
jgi:zinc transport system substrate-binding protein